MRGLLIAALSLSLPTASLAVEGDEPGRLIAALSGDWNADEFPDAVLLVQGADGMADIVVYQGDSIGLELSLTVPGAVFSGPMGGQTPGLVPLTETSFAILSEQTGIGRTPWMQRLTIAYRDGGMVVAGYTYSFYDRIDPAHSGTCDVNLLTGAYSLTLSPGEGRAGIARTARTAPHAIALSDLTEGFASPVCNDLF